MASCRCRPCIYAIAYLIYAIAYLIYAIAYLHTTEHFYSSAFENLLYFVASHLLIFANWQLNEKIGYFEIVRILQSLFSRTISAVLEMFDYCCWGTWVCTFRVKDVRTGGSKEALFKVDFMGKYCQLLYRIYQLYHSRHF